MADQPSPNPGADADGKIASPIEQVGEFVGKIELEAHVRVRSEEGGDVRHDMHAAEGGGRGEAQRPTHVGMAATDTFLGGLEGGTQREQRVVQVLPGRGERETARGAVDEADGETFLKAG